MKSYHLDPCVLCQMHYSKVFSFPTYPRNIPQTLNQQFMKEFLSFGGFGGILCGYVFSKKSSIFRVCSKRSFFSGPENSYQNAPKPCAALRFMNRFPWPALAVLLSAYSLGHVIEEDVDSWKLMSHEKKPSYFPWNPGWLIGILIMVFITPI